MQHPKSHPAVDDRAILVGDRDWSDVDAHFESGILPSIGELRSWLGSYRKTLEIPSIFPESVVTFWNNFLNGCPSAKFG